VFTRLHHHRLRWQTSNCSSLLIYRPQENKRLSLPSWLTSSGWFSHISGHPSVEGRACHTESSPAKDRHSTTVPCHQVSNKFIYVTYKKRRQSSIKQLCIKYKSTAQQWCQQVLNSWPETAKDQAPWKKSFEFDGMEKCVTYSNFITTTKLAAAACVNTFKCAVRTSKVNIFKDAECWHRDWVWPSNHSNWLHAFTGDLDNLTYTQLQSLAEGRSSWAHCNLYRAQPWDQFLS